MIEAEKRKDTLSPITNQMDFPGLLAASYWDLFVPSFHWKGSMQDYPGSLWSRYSESQNSQVPLLSGEIALRTHYTSKVKSSTQK